MSAPGFSNLIPLEILETLNNSDRSSDDFNEKSGGEGGIRTHGTDIRRYSRLAGDPDRPLQHLSARSLKARLFYHFFVHNLKNNS